LSPRPDVRVQVPPAFTAETPVARPGNDRVLRCHASES
jgi:hypothetical protein